MVDGYWLIAMYIGDETRERDTRPAQPSLLQTAGLTAGEYYPILPQKSRRATMSVFFSSHLTVVPQDTTKAGLTVSTVSTGSVGVQA